MPECGNEIWKQKKFKCMQTSKVCACIHSLCLSADDITLNCSKSDKR